MKDGDVGIGQYRADIDGLRAVAVLAVVGYHFFPGLVRGGYAGVDVFFVISGYLITGIVLRAQAADGVSLITFYRRRVVRIVPALLAVLLGSAALGALLQGDSDFAALGRHIAAAALMVPNLLSMHEAGYFDPAAELKPLLHLWSLGVEEQFYLVWPVAMLGLAAVSAPRWRWAVVLAVAACSLTWGVYTSHVDPVTAFYSPLGRAWELLAGALLALSAPARSATARSGPLGTANALAWGGAALVTASFMLLHRSLPYPGWAALLPVAGAVLLLRASPQAWLHRRVLAVPALVYVGRISYPWYLWHWPLLALARPYAEGLDLRQWVALKLVLVVVSFGLAAATFRWIEQPARRLQQQGSAQALVLALVGGLIALAALGAALLAARGLPQRAPDHVVGRAALLAELDRVGVCKAERIAGCSTAAPRWQDIDTLFVGDSHALAWFAGAPAQRTAYFGTPGCFPGTGLRWRNRASIVPVECDLYASLPALLARMPALRTVVVAARGPMYLDGRGFGIDAGRYDWSVSPAAPVAPATPLTAERTSLIGRGLAAVVDTALSPPSMPRVLLMQPVPELGFSPTECVVSRPPDWLLPRRAPCALARRDVDVRQAAYRALVESLPARRAGRVQVFDPLPLMCDRSWCHAQPDGVLWYADSDHLAPEGARAMLAQLPR